MMDWINSHTFTDTIFIFWIVSAAVGAMPDPAVDGSSLYRWFYEFITAVVGRWDDAVMAHHQYKEAIEARHRSGPNSNK